MLMHQNEMMKIIHDTQRPVGRLMVAFSEKHCGKISASHTHRFN